MNPGCTVPSSLAGAGANQFHRDCTRGEQYSSATTGLFISSLALGVAGTVSYLVGVHQGVKARGLEVAPAVSLNAAALQLRFPF